MEICLKALEPEGWLTQEPRMAFASAFFVGRVLPGEMCQEMISRGNLVLAQ